MRSKKQPEKPPEAEVKERRVPTQARSRERAKRILDAAAMEFGDVGFDAATTEGIALRAGTSVGSIYQFFPNKIALYNAIVQNYLEKARVLFEAFVQDAKVPRPWEDVIGSALDSFAAFDRNDPDARAVWTNLHVSSEFLQEGSALNRAFASQASRIIATHAPDMPEAQRDLAATLVIEVISAMLFLAYREKPKRAAQILGETKTMLVRYLTPYFTQAPAPAAPSTDLSDELRPRARARRTPC